MSTSIYDVQPVEGVRLTENVKVTSLELCESTLFIGTNTSAIISYSFGDSTNQLGDECISCAVLAQAVLHQDASSNVEYLFAASALSRLLALCHHNVFVLDLETATVLGVAKVKNVVAMSVNQSPVHDDPFVVEAALGLRSKKIQIVHFSQDDCQPIRSLSVEHKITAVSLNAYSLCAAADQTYVAFNLQDDTKHVFLESVDVQPIIQAVDKGEFLVTGMQRLGVFADGNGMSHRAPLLFGVDDVTALAYVPPYILSAHESCVTVYSIEESDNHKVKQRISVNGACIVGNYGGRLLVATQQRLFSLQSVSWRTQVETLLAENQPDEAVQIASKYTNRLKTGEEIEQYHNYCQRAAFLHLAATQFAQAKQLFIEHETDVREVISLFPGLLPMTTSLVRHQPPLHSLPNIDRVTGGQARLKHQAIEFLNSYLLAVRNSEFVTVHGARQDLDTALLKLSVLTDPPASIDHVTSVLLADWSGDANDVADWLAKRTDSGSTRVRAHLLWTVMKHYDEGVQLMVDAHEKQQWLSLPEITKLMSETQTPVAVLQKWLSWLMSVDEDMMFTVISSQQHRLSAEFVEELLVDQPIRFIWYLQSQLLDDAPDVKCDANESIVRSQHARLAHAFIDQLSNPALLDADREALRQAFRRFIEHSRYIDVTELATKMRAHRSLNADRAFLHGKNGEHDKALRVLIDEERDVESALQYCQLYVMMLDAGKRSSVYEHLVVRVCQVHELGKLPLDDVLKVLAVAAKYASLQKILSVLPPDVPLQSVYAAVAAGCSQTHASRLNNAIGAALGQHVLINTSNEHANVNAIRHDISEKTRCCVCQCTMVDSLTDVLIYPTGAVVHLACVRHRDLCPETNVPLSSL